MKYMSFETPIGKMFATEKDGKIFEIGIMKEEKQEYFKKNFVFENTLILEKAKTQLLEYFDKKRKNFNLPLKFVGTDFQKKVWQELLNIPFGKTASYKEIAQRIKKEKAVRAVGNANNKNNFLIVVPCHRVIGSNGNLVGYGEGLEIKQFLLDFEKTTF